ncbi:hypothetical protein LXA43DRAFT_1065571 [Ganoderma leucocontextum]|nr:hypothetical protein LXA43DRAFT_1065571 [Ganoderma leucocontextum]
MPQNELNNYPVLYIPRLPDQVVISVGGYDYHIDGDNAMRIDNATGHEESILGAVAKLPNGLSYVKTCAVWLLAPLSRVPKPMMLGENVGAWGFAYRDYQFIQPIPYTGGPTGPVERPWVIRLHVSMSAAKGGDFPGADKPAFPHIPGRTTFEEKLSISPSFLPHEAACLLISCRIRTKFLWRRARSTSGVTHGQLAKAIAREVEKTLDTPNQVLLAFTEEGLRQDVLFKFEDLLLGDFVQRTKGAFQVYIAVRVPP